MMLGLRSGSSESCLGWPKQLKQASRADPIPADFENCNTAVFRLLAARHAADRNSSPYGTRELHYM
jgi:hypothetical protein